VGKKVGRKPHGIEIHDLHVQVEKALYLKAVKRARAMKITLRTATEQGLELFLQRSTSAKSKLAS
jgi:hypothetical protein